MFKGLANLGQLMRQAQEMGGRMQEIQARLRTERVTGSAGGGMVHAELNGLCQVLRLQIDTSLVERNEREMIEDLVPAAINEAVQKARELHIELMRSLTSGLNLPGLDGALAGLTGLDAPTD